MAEQARARLHHDQLWQRPDGRVIEAVERWLLARVLRHTHGHQAQASDLLGVNRTTLRHKLRDLGLALDKVVTDEFAEEGAG